MSETNIYSALRNGGLSHAGACAMMGNMYCESLLRSNNVQDNCNMGDTAYTNAVDSGAMTRWQFMSDAYGYGLCQWTFSTRKDHLYMFAREKGVSIADEDMQCEFCLLELMQEYKDLFVYLVSTGDLPEATKKICAEFERPAVNNFADRINAATRYSNAFNNNTFNNIISEPNDAIESDDDAIDIIHPDNRTSFLHLEHGDGCTGTPHPAVKAWQNLLICWGIDLGHWGADGKFWDATEKATKEWQELAKLRGCGVEVNGVVDEDDWKAIIEVAV